MTEWFRNLPRSVSLIISVGLFGWLFRVWTITNYRPTCNTGATECYTIAGDAAYHHGQANLLADTGRYLNPNVFLANGSHVDSAGDPPLFAAYLAAWSKIGVDAVDQHRIAASLWGLVLIIVIGLFTRRLAGNAAGVIAAVIAAVHPLMWLNDMMLLSEGMYQPFVVLMFWAGYEWIKEPSRRNAVLLGVAIALATLIRAEAISLYAFMVLPLFWWVSTIDTREKVRQTILCGVAGLMLMSPWLIYNNLRFEEPVTVSAVTGTVMMAGACDTAWEGESIGIWARCFEGRNLAPELEAKYPGSWPDDEANRVTYDESVIDVFNREKAFEYYRDNWKRFPKVAIARVGRSFEFIRVGHTLRVNYQVEGRWEEPSTLGLGMYYSLVPFSLIGIALLRKRGKRLTPLLSMWPMIAFASISTFGLTRYRVPVDIAMIVLASVALSWIVHRLRNEGVFDSLEKRLTQR
ncbi:MAG: 4-amino-4-deoxy-L-arabinose transferase-like glycosyltransferase [Candidatus Aldehydirespiratoraceae bacterium]|jgi:4-amino-4-deoxy-L-arabinose transferase-like glycosyltransferase